MQCVFTQDWLNSFWIAIACPVLPFMNACLCLRKISINVNKLLAVLLLPVYLFIRFFLYSTLLLPVYFLVPFLYADVVAIFLIKSWSCKQTRNLVKSFSVYHFHFRNRIFVIDKLTVENASYWQLYCTKNAGHRWMYYLKCKLSINIQ